MFSRINSLMTIGWLCLFAVIASAQPASLPENPPQIDGVLGLETEDGHGWLAIKVDFDDAYAMSGVLWYNNDGMVVFPSVCVGTGYDSGPDAIATCIPMAQSLSGDSDGWSECMFTEPVAASLGGLYVVFEFPIGGAFESRGQDGGPAVGFSNGLTESHGWISGDGETWHPLAGDFGFAVLPLLVEVTEGMLVKSMGDGNDGTPDVPSEFYVKVGPNPFNPKVVVRFGLPKSGATEINVFDVRGRLVTRLLNEELDAGHHEVIWAGTDSAGRRVSSGSYLLRISSGSINSVQRVTIVK